MNLIDAWKRSRTGGDPEGVPPGFAELARVVEGRVPDAATAEMFANQNGFDVILGRGLPHAERPGEEGAVLDLERDGSAFRFSSPEQAVLGAAHISGVSAQELDDWLDDRGPWKGEEAAVIAVLLTAEEIRSILADSDFSLEEFPGGWVVADKDVPSLRWTGPSPADAFLEWSESVRMQPREIVRAVGRDPRSPEVPDCPDGP